MSSPLLEIVDALRAFADRQSGLGRGSEIGSRAGRAQLAEDRRAHVRLRPVQLDRPVLARLKPGPLLTLVDVSAGGALIETPARLTPGAHVLLEFLEPGTRRSTVLRSRVMRAQVAALDERYVRYRGACSFDQMLPLADLVAPDNADCGDLRRCSTDPSLRTILEPHVASLAACRNSTPADALRELRRVLANEPASADDTVAELLDDLIQIAPRYGSRNALIGYVDEWLRRRVPLLALRVNAASHRSPRIDGMLSFGLRDTGRSGAPRAHVEFRPACALDESQVRLLEAGACVMSVLLATR